jgi:F-type H+-transporting ATPase subunit b
MFMVSVAIDISLFIQIINFFVLVFMLNLFLYKPLRKMLQERETLFESYRELSDVATKQLEDGEEEKARRRAESLSAGLETMGELKAAGQAREKEILASAQEAAAKRLEESRARLAQESGQARLVLEAEAQKLAADLASQFLGRQI